MALDRKNLLIRTISGVVYIGLIVGAVLWGSVGIAMLCSILAAGACYELEKNTTGETTGILNFIDYSSMILLMWLCLKPMETFMPLCLILWAFLVFLRVILQVFLPCKNPVKYISISLFAQFYIAFPLALFCYWSSFVTNPLIIICTVAMIWVNDTGAYLIGSSMGRHKLIPRLSPHKSWEGFFGGILFNIGAAFLYYYCFKLNSFPLIDSVGGWIFIGIIVSLLSTVGDLFESLLKRSLGIKDFGSVIPGHGGILDRIDSLLFVVPGLTFVIIVFCYLCFLIDRI